MKKYFYLVILLVATQLIYSQVGIGTQTPSTKSILDLTATDKGFLLPRMTTAERTAIAPNTTTDKGMQVFDTTTNSIWYWDGSVWVALGGGASSGDMSNDNWTDVMHDISGDPVIYAPNQVGIGQTGTSPSLYAKLAVASGNQGVLLPKIDLTSSTMDLDSDNDSDISNQPVGLLIFNEGNTLAQGYYFWNGTEWRNVKDSSSVMPSLTTINCLSVTLSPKVYVAGAPYVGSLSVAYTGGNGASYSAGTAIPSTGVTGLNATLRAGTLNVGDGVLIYDITGTPSASSPSTATFALPTTFGATGCNVTVGQGNVFAIGEIQSFRVVVDAATFFTNSGSITKATNSSGATAVYSERNSYSMQTPEIQAQYPIINGLRMDFIEKPSNANFVSPTLLNTTGANITFSISGLSTNDSFVNGGNTILPPNTYSYRIDGDDTFGLGSGVGGTSEYVNAMLTFSTGEWYQLTYHASRDTTNVYFYMTAQRLN